jgi:hypothetical protein
MTRAVQTHATMAINRQTWWHQYGRPASPVKAGLRPPPAAPKAEAPQRPTSRFGANCSGSAQTNYLQPIPALRHTNHHVLSIHVPAARSIKKSHSLSGEEPSMSGDGASLAAPLPRSPSM